MSKFPRHLLQACSRPAPGLPQTCSRPAPACNKVLQPATPWLCNSDNKRIPRLKLVNKNDTRPAHPDWLVKTYNEANKA